MTVSPKGDFAWRDAKTTRSGHIVIKNCDPAFMRAILEHLIARVERRRVLPEWE